ncbi:MAG: carotenoid oxygenase family protein [Prochloraceae cyanobacterium]
MSVATINRYLQGNFAPSEREIDADNLEVIGQIPADLSGIFLRNGPNPQFPPLGQYHWFDGDGMLHEVQIKGAQASYRNRYVKTEGFKLEKEANKAIWSGILEPPQMDLPYGPSKNTANTALVWHSGKLLALWEGGSPYELELLSLETLGPYNFNGQLDCSFTAHPKIDPETGELIFFSYSLVQSPYVKYGIVSATGELSPPIEIDIPIGVMMHDFAVTKNYIIFMELPYTYRQERAEKGEAALMFESERPSRFGIVPRHGENKAPIWFESPACYVFHTLNAYEENDEVVLIACRSDSSNAISSSDIISDPETDLPKLHRWRFNLATKEVLEERLSEVACEFPRINETLIGRKNRYGYLGTIAPTPVPLFDGLMKYDFEQLHSKIYKFGEGRFGGEAVFVSKVNPLSEDDGYLITFVHDENSETSELVIVDAKEFDNGVIARVIIPQRVPYGFHGLWISQSDLSN